MERMSLLGMGACAPDPVFRASLPFAANAIERGALPPALRRRASQAMQLAFTAADSACQQARLAPAELPAIFASVGGEIQVTDQLCLELGTASGIISPTAFHNSVHNTAAGYWSIAHRCTQPISALAAGHETFAMAMLEAWCQLECQGGAVLLVCYDERWPDYLAAGMGEPAFACAMVLGADSRGMAEISRPYRGGQAPEASCGVVAQMPITAAIPLLALALADVGEREVPLSNAAGGWRVCLKTLGGMEGIHKPSSQPCSCGDPGENPLPMGESRNEAF
jgi:hypothetical protein